MSKHRALQNKMTYTLFRNDDELTGRALIGRRRGVLPAADRPARQEKLADHRSDIHSYAPSARDRAGGSEFL